MKAVIERAIAFVFQFEHSKQINQRILCSALSRFRARESSALAQLLQALVFVFQGQLQPCTPRRYPTLSVGQFCVPDPRVGAGASAAV
jgi:hypothetical protein